MMMNCRMFFYFQLGCGVGVPGLFAYNKGAEVHFQDYVSYALKYRSGFLGRLTHRLK